LNNGETVKACNRLPSGRIAFAPILKGSCRVAVTQQETLRNTNPNRKRVNWLQHTRAKFGLVEIRACRNSGLSNFGLVLCDWQAEPSFEFWLPLDKHDHSLKNGV